jgi:hypothetical protein
MVRVTITLNNFERDALLRLAVSERRDPRAQAAVLIREALVFHRLLPSQEMNASEIAARDANAANKTATYDSEAFMSREVEHAGSAN